MPGMLSHHRAAGKMPKLWGIEAGAHRSISRLTRRMSDGHANQSSRCAGQKTHFRTAFSGPAVHCRLVRRPTE